MNNTPKNTMTTGELIQILSRHPEDTPVLATWEGVKAPIRIENITIEEYDGVSILDIDVEEY